MTEVFLHTRVTVVEEPFAIAEYDKEGIDRPDEVEWCMKSDIAPTSVFIYTSLSTSTFRARGLAKRDSFTKDLSNSNSKTVSPKIWNNEKPNRRVFSKYSSNFFYVEFFFYRLGVLMSVYAGCVYADFCPVRMTWFLGDRYHYFFIGIRLRTKATYKFYISDALLKKWNFTIPDLE